MKAGINEKWHTGPESGNSGKMAHRAEKVAHRAEKMAHRAEKWHTGPRRGTIMAEKFDGCARPLGQCRCAVLPQQSHRITTHYFLSFHDDLCD